ncbi:OLC1v1018632C3 [Oldenlandia corymbosa var. corymbosa]|uniref:OLC1v1018632C3 n=1 Tax=Oldenlandia corymbosa var. corymbosa TaxID=529605 RepID=A0AAV1EC58_OLDCO|nr:OLC1v1018632C3 [Oldenlandia corymbosa var. corymbosa]
MNHTLSHILSFPIHDDHSKLCRFTHRRNHHRFTVTSRVYAKARRHYRSRLRKQQPASDDSFSPPSEQSLQLILAVDKFANSKPVSLLGEVVDSSQLKFNQFIHSAEEAVEDLRTLVTVDGATKRVVFSCKKSTVQFLGFVFAACLVVSVSFRVLVSLLMYGKDRLSGNSGGVIYRRDRSLGGKVVAVGQTDSGTVKRRKESRNDMFMLMLEDGNENRKPFWQRTKRKSVERLPQWWPVSGLNPNSSEVVDHKEEYQMLANRLIRALMDKRMRGEDVTPDDIVQLRRVCKVSGVSVSIDTENTRDSFYRAAVDFVLKYCESTEDQNAFVNIGGEDARHFLAGLSENIVLESGRAARMVSAAVAARTRSRFLQAWALQMQGNHFEAVAELSKICLIHRIFPPEENSAEMEMVARGLKKQLNVEQRELLLNMLIRTCGEATRRSVTEALGLVP